MSDHLQIIALVDELFQIEVSVRDVQADVGHLAVDALEALPG